MLKTKRSWAQFKKKKSSAGSKGEGSTKKEVAGFKVAAAVISRRSQNGTIILMNTYKAISFFKIEGIATEVWRCFESAQSIKAVTEHMADVFPKHAKTLARNIEGFVKELVKLELLSPAKGPYSESFPAILPESLKFEAFGGIQEFNLDKIESEVLNDSLYLDVFAGSDLRLKSDIEPIVNALDKVLKLEGITHTWKKGVPVKNRKAVRAGLIAQQVAMHMPELVRKDAKGILAVDYQKMSSYLVESIKDLNRIIEKQDERLSKLEAALKQ